MGQQLRAAIGQDYIAIGVSAFQTYTLWKYAPEPIPDDDHHVEALLHHLTPSPRLLDLGATDLFPARSYVLNDLRGRPDAMLCRPEILAGPRPEILAGSDRS